MNWIFKLIDFICRETWWRKYYKRVYISEEETWKGRCVICQAATSHFNIPDCGKNYKRDCPCKYNQRLILKKEMREKEEYDRFPAIR